MIVYRFRELWEAKQKAEDRRIPLTEIARETGISRNTLSKLADVRERRYVTNTDVIDRLCRYFRVQPGDILAYIPTDQEGGR